MDVLPLYFSQHLIKHHELDATGKFSLSAMANHIQENAAEHARRLNVGYANLLKNNHIWMLSRLRVQIYSCPGIGSNIETETWVKDFDRLFSYRDFHFKHNDEIFAVANTAWIIADIDNKKLVPVEDYVANSYKLTTRCLVNYPIPKLKGVENKAEHVFMHKVRISSIDINQHVNHVSYLSWYLDYLPENLAHQPVVEITVNYMHELKINNKVNIYYLVEETDEAHDVKCEMTNAETDQSTCRIRAIHKK